MYLTRCGSKSGLMGRGGRGDRLRHQDTIGTSLVYSTVDSAKEDLGHDFSVHFPPSVGRSIHYVLQFGVSNLVQGDYAEVDVPEYHSERPDRRQVPSKIGQHLE